MSKPELMTTGEISEALELNLNVKFLKSMGFEPYLTMPVGCYWKKADVPIMCMKICERTSQMGMNFINDNYGSNKDE